MKYLRPISVAIFSLSWISCIAWILKSSKSLEISQIIIAGVGALGGVVFFVMSIAELFIVGKRSRNPEPSRESSK